MMAKGMTDDQLRQFIERQESRAARTEVAEEQAQAMDYYLRRPFGNEEEGRSQVISSDVWDVVEGMTPMVLKPFVSSPDVVHFNPQGQEDEEAAKQETDYLNYVVTQRNDSFIQFMAWAKAGLLQKNGVVKYWWDKSRRARFESFEGLDDNAFSLVVNDENATVLEHTERQDTDETGAVVTLHDFKIRYVDEVGIARFAVIPPEEFLIIGDNPNPQTASFTQHRTRMTISALREMGYDVKDDIADTMAGDPSMEPQAAARNVNRDMWLGENSDGSGDPSMREVWHRESYARVDFDGDGIAELRKVCMVGSEILANEEVGEMPFAGWTPYQQLFQFDGRCPADETIEVQDIKSTLWRQSLDNIYTINNNRVFAGNKVNLDDLMDNQIAGIVRVESEDVGRQVQSLPITPLGPVIQPMIEYVDSAKENRTGFTRYNQGSDADSLNKTATGVRIISQAGQERIGLVQRSLAEQGMKTLMLGLHGLCRRHSTKAETIRLRGKWVDIDPRSWKARYDMTVSVGLGTMDKTLELSANNEIIKMISGAAIPAGVATPENLYNALAKQAELTGEKNPDKYFTHPDKIPPKEPPNPMDNPEFVLQKAELELKEAGVKQKDRELDQRDRELDQADAQMGITRMNADLDAQMRYQELLRTNELHDKTMQAPDPNALKAEGLQLQAQGQEHSQGLAEEQQAMAAQGQEHSQTMAERAAEQAEAAPKE